MLMLILVWITFLLWVYVKYVSRSVKNKDEPPLIYGAIFLLGHALHFIGDSVNLWKRIKILHKEAGERGGVLKATVGPKTLYFVTTPEDYTAVVNNCLKKFHLNDFARRWLGDGLLTAVPSTWRHDRRLINPSFGTHVIDSFLGIFNTQSRRFVKNLEAEVGKGPFDHYAYSHRNALEAICSTALGGDFMANTEKANEYVNTVHNILNILISRFQRFWLHSDFFYYFSSLKRKEDKCIKIINIASKSILKQKKESYANNLKNTENNSKGPKYKPFIDLLLELSYDKNVFTDQRILEHVDTIIVAGSDTTGTTITYCMLMIGSIPEVQDKIYQELKNVMGNEDRDVTKEDCSRLVYLEAVIKESLRYWPTIPIIGRDLLEDIKLRNCTLLKGTSAYMSLYSICNNPAWGADVKEFKPERWLNPSSVPEWANNVSFGFGRRFCIGKTYAMKFMKVTLAHICRNYILHGDHTKMKLKLDVLLKPVSGHYMSIEKRNDLHKHKMMKALDSFS